MPVTSKNCHAFPNDDNQKLMYTHPHKKKGGGAFQLTSRLAKISPSILQSFPAFYKI